MLCKTKTNSFLATIYITAVYDEKERVGKRRGRNTFKNSFTKRVTTSVKMSSSGKHSGMYVAQFMV